MEAGEAIVDCSCHLLLSSSKFHGHSFIVHPLLELIFVPFLEMFRSIVGVLVVAGERRSSESGDSGVRPALHD